MEALNTELLETLKSDILRPAVVEPAIALALEALRPDRQDEARATVERELGKVRAECERLADGIEAGGPLDVLVERLKGRQTRRQELEAQLVDLRPFEAPPTGRGLEARLRAKLADWRSLLTEDVESGRGVLSALLVGPVRFTPIDTPRRRAYAFEGRIALDRLVSGVIELPTLTRMASPTGFDRGGKEFLRDFRAH
jgi:hypothetical protein